MLMNKGRIHHSVSSLSIDSSSTINEDGTDILLPKPSNLIECNEELVKFQAQLDTENRELNNFSGHVKELRRQKEPLMKIKDVLQKEIAHSNEVINMKSEEVTQLKNKLRHHSEKQIQTNIERLEYQLRNNNYKPKEEQKILAEISMLQRSSKTLKEYTLKELENKKYRSERNRLIEQRNEIYSSIHLVYGREEKEKREVNKMRRIIVDTTKIINHLLNCQSEFDRTIMEEKRLKNEIVQKKFEEKARLKKDQYIKRQEDRKKLWEEYEASREPYEEEKARCKVLIAYMEKLLPFSDRPSVNGDEVDAPRVTLTRSQTAPARTTCGARLESLKTTPLLQKLDGTFYTKQKDEECTITRRMSKKEKAKARKELRTNKAKVLSHPPDVLADLLKMKLHIPKTSDNIPFVIESLKSILEEYYHHTEIPTSVKVSTSDQDVNSSSMPTQPPAVGTDITDNITINGLPAKTPYAQMNGDCHSVAKPLPTETTGFMEESAFPTPSISISLALTK